MTNRIYAVSDETTGNELLVRAGNPSQAIRHAVRGRFKAAVASQDDLIRLLSKGVKVEEAGESTED